jgi:SAM-dependent methyltransferase
VGQQLKARWKDAEVYPGWFDATVLATNDDGTFRIKYTDGSIWEEAASSDLVTAAEVVGNVKSVHEAISEVLAVLGEGWHEGENWNDGLMHWAEGDSFAPPLPSDTDDMFMMLSHAGALGKDDTFVDLGCGDGRLCLAAATLFDCHAVGVEIEKDFADKFRNAAAMLGLQDRVTSICGDILDFELCVSKHTVVVLYLLPDALKALRERLVVFIKSGGCVISSTWGLPGLKATEEYETGCFKLRVYRGEHQEQQEAAEGEEVFEAGVGEEDEADEEGAYEKQEGQED